MREDTSEIIGTCAICGNAIHEDEDHYEMPYAELVCDCGNCLDEWLQDYRVYGGIPLI